MVPLGQGNGWDTRVRVAVESRRDKEGPLLFMTQGKYYESNKVNTKLQAKVNELQDMCQHMLWQATHNAAVTELQCRRAIGNSGGGSTL